MAVYLLDKILWKVEAAKIKLALGGDISKKVQTAIEWIKAISSENDLIKIDFPNYQAFFTFQFPLFANTYPKKIHERGIKPNPTFLITDQKLNSDTGEFTAVFSSKIFSLYEKPSRTEAERLRFKLSEELAMQAVAYARETLNQFVTAGKKPDYMNPPDLPAHFFEKADLGITIWHMGKVLGSYVVTNCRLWSGIQKATVHACLLPEMKPITKAELPQIRIQITYLTSPGIPASQNERERTLYYDKAYFLKTGERYGWYFPHIFNIRRFRSARQFLEELAEEKAKAPDINLAAAEVRIFETRSFIETSDHSNLVFLRGPIRSSISPIAPKEFIYRLKSAAGWLCSLQEPSGNIPPVFNPLNGIEKPIDWARLALTGWGIFEYGMTFGDQECIQVAERIFYYLKKYLAVSSRRSISHHVLAYTFFGELAYSLDQRTQFAGAAAFILNHLDHESFEPITHLHAASFLMQTVSYHRNTKQIESLEQAISAQFKKVMHNPASVNIVAWSEIMRFLQIRSNPEYQKITEWLLSLENEDGSFPETQESGFCYTRGTAKIFEALASVPSVPTERLTLTLGWLFLHQYDESTSFFVSPLNMGRIQGGFRHDALNPDTWIDAAGHLLLGAARLKKAGKI